MDGRVGAASGGGAVADGWLACAARGHAAAGAALRRAAEATAASDAAGALLGTGRVSAKAAWLRWSRRGRAAIHGGGGGARHAHVSGARRCVAWARRLPRAVAAQAVDLPREADDCGDKSSWRWRDGACGDCHERLLRKRSGCPRGGRLQGCGRGTVEGWAEGGWTTRVRRGVAAQWQCVCAQCVVVCSLPDGVCASRPDWGGHYVHMSSRAATVESDSHRRARCRCGG